MVLLGQRSRELVEEKSVYAFKNFIFCMIDATWPWSSDPHISRQISYAGKSKADEMYILLKIWIYLCTYMYLG